MKRIKTKLLIGSLLMFAFKAFATDCRGNCDGISVSAGASALAGSASYANGGSVGNVNARVTQNADFSDLKIVPSAISPNISQNVICPITNLGSGAASVFFFSGSGTRDAKISAVCLAWHSNDKELVHAIACNESKEYKKASMQLGRVCPK